MNILIYYQNNDRAVFLESLSRGFIKREHKVHLLTTSGEGELHDRMKKLGVNVHAYDPASSKLLHYVNHFFHLISFCRKNKIDVVYSHLQFANLIAVMAQGFIKAKVFPCRHHADDVMLGGNSNALFMDKTINRRAKCVIVCSNAAKEHMVKHENADPAKIHVIRLCYDFDLYPKPDPAEVERIRKQMSCKLLLIVISRMTPNKKNILAAQVLIDLCKKGLDVKMIMMDDGPEKQKIKSLLKENKMEEKVLFTGFTKNTMNYLEAADLLLHPSFSEASNQVVKEAGFLNKPSIVCKGVGDFEEYIINGKNGFLVNKDNVVIEMEALVEKYYSNTSDLKQMGIEIHNTIVKTFPVEPVCEKYLELMLN